MSPSACLTVFSVLASGYSFFWRFGSDSVKNRYRREEWVNIQGNIERTRTCFDHRPPEGTGVDVGAGCGGRRSNCQFSLCVSLRRGCLSLQLLVGVAARFQQLRLAFCSNAADCLIDNHHRRSDCQQEESCSASRSATRKPSPKNTTEVSRCVPV